MAGRAAMDERELRDLLVSAHRILHHQGLVDYLGHASVRLPGTDHVLIKPKHSPRIRSIGDLTPADLVVIDLDGKPVHDDPDADIPPAERFIHTEIYRARPDVSAVVHTHQPATTLLGVMNADLLPVLHVPSVLADGGRVANWPCPLLVENAELGHDMATALGDHALCHLQGHGIVSVGTDIRRATLAAVGTEQLAEANLAILQAGRQPRVITASELTELGRALAGIEGRWAYYLELAEPHAA
jgi:ribulose-5-phosphate 4-epimerase/fuculose-1-phosphate aldolase